MLTTKLDLTLLKKEKLELRDYQVIAAENALTQNTLVVMPTALGKTFIAALVAAHVLKNYAGKKILFLAPTKPLVLQQAERLKELLDIPPEETAVVTGEIAPEKRGGLYSGARLVCGTPQTISHDLLTRKLDLKDFELVVFDEAHRTVGDYAYVFIGQQSQTARCLVLGLTASPSSQKEKIEEICGHLGIKHIELKHEHDDDVKKYVNKVKLDWIFVDLPAELLEIRGQLQEMLREDMNALKEGGYLETADLSKINKRDLLALRPRIVADIKTTPKAYQAISTLAKAMNLTHAIDLLESQGVKALKEFINGMKERKQQTKAVRSLLSDFRLTKIEAQCASLLEKHIEHPKVDRLKQLVGNEAKQGKTIIVFAHYRGTVDYLLAELNALDGVQARKLIGRAEGGMTQKQQRQMLEEFNAGAFNVMVATSIGEEGLDIKSVDLVVFYEAVPSEIRAIQRRGRAGRVKAGNAVILVTRKTKDEAYLWIARKKERIMHENIKQVSRELNEDRVGKLEDYM